MALARDAMWPWARDRRPPPLPAPPPVYYTFASGTLLVINKVAIVSLPAPTFVLLGQLAFSVIAVLAAHMVGAVTIQPATTRQLIHFLPVVAGFLGTIYANIKVLQFSNVETFITFRSSTPLVLAFCDWAFLGRKLPCTRSWLSLTMLLLSSAGYAYFDDGFVVNAYVWLIIWYVFFTFEGVWVKHMVRGLGRVPRTHARAPPLASQMRQGRGRALKPLLGSVSACCAQHLCRRELPRPHLRAANSACCVVAPHTQPPAHPPPAHALSPPTAPRRSATPCPWATGRACTTPT